MADAQNKRINDLPVIEGDDVSGVDVLPIVDQSTFATKKILFSELKQQITKDSQEKLPGGTDGQVLSWQSGEPVWIDFTPEGMTLNIGPSDQDNSWRFTLTGNGLELQVRRMGVWEKRGAWSNA